MNDLKVPARITTFATIVSYCLCQIRIDENYSVRKYSEEMKVSASVWDKVESGDGIVTLNMLESIASHFRIWPSRVLQTAEDIQVYLIEHGWDVLSNPENDEDLLQKILTRSIQESRIRKSIGGLRSFLNLRPRGLSRAPSTSEFIRRLSDEDSIERLMKELKID